LADPDRGPLGSAVAAIRSTEKQVCMADEIDGVALRYGLFYDQDSITRTIVNAVRKGEPHSDLVVTEVVREPVLAVLTAGHPLAGRPVLDLAALAGEPLILWGRWGGPDFHDAVITACVRAGFTPRIGRRVRGIVSRLGYIAAGLGVGLEAASYATLRHEGLVFRPLRDDPIEATVQLARTRRPLTPAAARPAAVLSG
jgi:DNA-binding transcriptional LysR family regulator